MKITVKLISCLTAMFLLLFGVATLGFGQETTGSLSGTIKDPSGAVIQGAEVSVTTPTLPGAKTTETDSKGYYHLANLPPGAYVITVNAKGFETLKRAGLVIEVGHSPTVDLTLTVGATSTVVEVNAQGPMIDTTTVTTQTNITQNEINYIPRGRSFQSVIEFAPGASEEPLMGNSLNGTGTGSGSPGSQTNGGGYGYSIAGGSDSENSYLVEGQETANLIGGYSHAQVPFDFIQEVQVKSSGVEAEYGGALGGVVNVIMKKGTQHYHGSVFAMFENQGLDASPAGFWFYNPLASDTPLCSGACVTNSKGVITNQIADLDQAPEYYAPQKSHFSYTQPGFTLGGPLFPFWSKMSDRLFFFVGFNPELDRIENRVNYDLANKFGQTPAATGIVPFSQNTNTYYTYARVDAKVTDKIRVFGSWLYQLQRQYGENTPGLYIIGATNFADSANGQYNPTTGSLPSTFAHSLGFDAPNSTTNTGVDYTITNNLVSTTRFGYYFENYHDFGFPNSGQDFDYQTTTTASSTAYNGGPLDPSLIGLVQGNTNQAQVLQTYYNSNKAIQLDQDIAWTKSTPWGTHNLKFGYQLNRRSNLLSEAYNAPRVQLYIGANQSYSPETSVGPTNCASIETADNTADCQGQYGWIQVYDYGVGGSAIDYNHGLFVQDAWSLTHGLTLNLGVRLEKENLPGEVEGPGVPPNPIAFGWSQKVAPRLGAAWDVFQDGKLKIFGSYGVFDDTMKLNLAISSFGGEYWNECDYAYNSGALSTINVAYNGSKRSCPGIGDNSTAIFGSGQPSGLQYIESVNERAAVATCATCNPYEEAVAPNLQPYRQHETLFGTAYQLSRTMALEVRYDRRRLDHVIEDSSIFNPALGGETFVIVNPGQGVNSTFSNFCSFLYSSLYTSTYNPCASGNGAFPPNQGIAAARSYDGIEVRLNKAISNHWFGLFSYTYSYFRGNYTGLTSSDQADSAEGFSEGGRVAPNNSRAFDEPYFSYNSYGGSSSGRLPTDRPNKLKIDAYYEVNEGERMKSDFGVFDYIYQGTPNATYIQDVGATANEDFPQYIYGRGKWANISQNQSTGVVTVGSPGTYRNPVYAETDFNFNQTYSLGGSKALSFSATFANLFNERAVTSVYEQADSASPNVNNRQNVQIPGPAFSGATGPGTGITVINGVYYYSIAAGVPWYAAVMNPYNAASLLQSNPGSIASPGFTTAPQVISNLYGKPYTYQIPRNVRLAVHFTF